MRNKPNAKAILLFPAITCLVFLFIGGPSHYSPRSFKNLWDLGHIIAFGLWTYLFLLFFSKITTHSFTRLCVTMLAGATLLGALTEFAQHWFDGRTPSYSDLGKDIFGCAIVLAFSSTSMKLPPPTVKTLIRSIVIFLLFWQLWPLTKALVDERIAARQFPVIADFETPFEIDRWLWPDRNKVSIVKEGALQSNHSLGIELTPGRYSGLSLKYFIGNWQGYSHFEFDIKNTLQEDISLTCRIHDKNHIARGQQYTDRFNQSFTIEPGWQHITIKMESITNAPQERKMDITNIIGFGIFASNLQINQTIYLDNIRLTK